MSVCNALMDARLLKTVLDVTVGSCVPVSAQYFRRAVEIWLLRMLASGEAVVAAGGTRARLRDSHSLFVV